MKKQESDKLITTGLTRRKFVETTAIAGAAAAVGFGIVATAACLLPAWRTTQVDVVEVLKQE